MNVVVDVGVVNVVVGVVVVVVDVVEVIGEVSVGVNAAVAVEVKESGLYSLGFKGVYSGVGIRVVAENKAAEIDEV